MGHDGTNIFHLAANNSAGGRTDLTNSGVDNTLGIFSPPDPAGWNSAVYAVAFGLGSGVWSFSYGGDGITGSSWNNASSQNGVRGQAMRPGVSGVYGENIANGGGFGVAGRSRETGVFGESTGGIGEGVRGVGQGFAAGVYGTSTDGVGVQGFSANGTGVYAYGSLGLFATGSAGRAAQFFGNVFIDGDQTVTGSKSAVVPHPDGSRRRLYALDSPESWFEDFGQAFLENGRVEVEIDPEFAALVRAGDYQVFLTPYGDCRGLYVSDRRHSGFSVRELQNGHSKISFGYRVLARRRDVETERLARVEIPQRPASRDPSDLSLLPIQPEPLAVPDMSEGTRPPSR